jgi:hypothetical protein
LIMRGSELGTKLQAEWRRMRNGRELYWCIDRDENRCE